MEWRELGMVLAKYKLILCETWKIIQIKSTSDKFNLMKTNELQSLSDDFKLKIDFFYKRKEN